MKHHKQGRTLGRTKQGREALLRSLARSLVLNEGIVTTVAKAKELRPFVERIVSISKNGSVASKRLTAARLGSDSEVMKKLYGTIAPRYAKRAGGYTRIVRLGQIGKRVGESARIEFVQ
jgi:large subunit ribosomal protein L17